MEPNQIAAFELIEQAQQAMKKGEFNTARQLAARAAQKAPELEEVWLIMAALASPKGSVAFIQKALDINPQSERAQKGMAWAQKRLQQELDKQAAAAAPTVHPTPDMPVVVPLQSTRETFEEKKPDETEPEPIVTLPDIDRPVLEETPESAVSSNYKPTDESASQPVDRSSAVFVAPETPEAEKTAPMAASGDIGSKTSPNKPIPASSVPDAAQEIQAEKSSVNRRYTSLAVPAVIIGCLALIMVLVFALFNSSSAAAQFNSNRLIGKEHGPAWASVNMTKTNADQAGSESATMPTATPLASATPEMLVPPTVAATDIPQPTGTPLPTSTSAPTQVLPTATVASSPTQTSLPTATPTATVEVAAVEGSSPTPLPTDTAVPAATPYAAPTARASSGGNNTTAGASGERWIDVDLTHQMVYAFEGNTVVNSFLVSTGTWQHPTVTGQYHVYVKYASTTMSGPGYSLPNVPYTMYFYKGYGLHGTYWHSNFGTPMSHGCVNLTIPDAQWLYNWASVGTLVNVHY